MFLAVLKRKVIDVEADPNADPPVAEQSHLEVAKVFVEESAEQVVRGLENNPDLDYYNIAFNGAPLNAALQPVSLKAGPRAAAPAREIAEIEAAGQVVGSAVLQV